MKINISFVASPLMKYAFFASLNEINGIFIPKIWISSIYYLYINPSSKIYLLTVSRRRFFCISFKQFMSGFCFAFVCVCLLMPCGHLLGKCWPLSSRLWSLIVKLLFFYWYPGSGVVLDCIYSWSFLLFLTFIAKINKHEQSIVRWHTNPLHGTTRNKQKTSTVTWQE